MVMRQMVTPNTIAPHITSRTSGIPGVYLFEYDQESDNNYQHIILEIDKELSGLSIDVF